MRAGQSLKQERKDQILLMLQARQVKVNLISVPLFRVTDRRRDHATI